MWNNILILPHSTNILPHSTRAQNNDAETLWKNGMWKNLLIFPNSIIFNRSLEQCSRKIVGKWNVEDYLNSSKFHIYSSIFICSSIFEISLKNNILETLWKYKCGNIYELFHTPHILLHSYILPNLATVLRKHYDNLSFFHITHSCV